MSDKYTEVLSMLSKLAKFEEMINGLISKVLSFFYKLLLKLVHLIIPKIVFEKANQIKEKSSSKSQQAKAGVKTKLSQFYNFFGQKKDAFFEAIDSAQKFPIKDWAKDKLINIKTFLILTSPKIHARNLSQYIKFQSKIFVHKLNELRKNQITLKTSLIALALIGSFGVYISFFDIYNQENTFRAPASAQEYDYRPNYELYERKTITIQNIKVPIIVESVGKVDSITIDFSLRLSTRFAKHYLITYEYKLKDYFFTGVEPIISDFVLKEEGKEVLKEKIQEEINYFLRDNNVEGEVEDVHILYIVGS
ncbi:MAG: hypothetical protein HON90_06250 [Halobacteriovoraceae bacterium]|nr:hypothetical protein [Halobacteriovoraceae bacterium]